MFKDKLVLMVVVGIGLLMTGALVAAALWPVINVVETGKTAEYPDLLPQYYTADPQRVYDESAASVGELERWQVVKKDASRRVIEAEAKTRMMGFVDDVTIRVEPVTEFVVSVQVRSASRVGKGDFGQNARNIRKFQTELDERLGAMKFVPGKHEEDAEEAAD